MEIETYSASAPGDIAGAIEAFNRAFDAFKAANDERLGAIERHLGADVLSEEKVTRIEAALCEHKAEIDRLRLAGQRPRLEAEREGRSEHVRAFADYVRKGEAQRLQRFEAKALSSQSDPEGGYLVPRETELMIDRVLSTVSPIRAIASVRQVGAASYRKPVSLGGAETGWVGETAARGQTNQSPLSLLAYPVMELYAMPAATQAFLDDAEVDVERWIADETQFVFAEAEGAAFVSGDGIARPRGFLSYEKVADASHGWGKVAFTISGDAAGFPATDPGDALLGLVYALRQGHRANGRWVMNRKTLAAIRKFKDGEGNYLWQPGFASGGEASLLGYPVTEAEDMPDLGAGAFPVAFGDFARFYLVVDRLGMRILRDPYSAKPHVLFYTTKRVGGGVQDFNAVKLLKIAAS